MQNQQTVEIRSLRLNILVMPLKYRKGCDVFRDKSEIVLKKEDAQKDVQNLKRRIIVTDERENRKYQSERFIEGQINQASSLVLSRVVKEGRPYYYLNFVTHKLNCIKNEDEKQVKSRNDAIDRTIDARHKPHDYEQVAHRRQRSIVHEVPNFRDNKYDSSGESDSNGGKNPRRHLLEEEDRARKKHKPNPDSQDDSSSISESENSI